MGRDFNGSPEGWEPYISIHSPRMGRDRADQWRTRPKKYFNPLSPHGERPRCNPHTPLIAEISIHSPRMGRDAAISWRSLPFCGFQSTLPAWGETHTCMVPNRSGSQFQSTLPAWGETTRAVLDFLTQDNFNPLSPHGERPPTTAPACWRC